MHIDPPFSFDNFSFVGEFGVSWEFKCTSASAHTSHLVKLSLPNIYSTRKFLRKKPREREKIVWCN